MVNKRIGTKEAVKATQVAFQLEQHVAKIIHNLAVSGGLTTSSQIRKILGLSYSPPKRPRLTVSLSEEDYKILAAKYSLNPENTMEIKREIMRELIKVARSNS